MRTRSARCVGPMVSEVVFVPPAGATGVLVGLSGGVDSAVAALLLQQSGLRVEAVTFALWSDPACSQPNLCCSAESILAARATAEQLGIEHHLLDLADPFLRDVVEPFVEEYARARTPNPCVRCNARLRFPALRSLAEQLGLSHVATGHYARLGGQPPRLRRAVAVGKDQSYVLAQVPPDLLAGSLFPLGGLSKALVRQMALRAGLPVHSRPESQEACFIPDNDYRRFLRTRVDPRPGVIVDLAGKEIGRHRSYFDFTVGQRKGLGIAAPAALYVVALRESSAEVVVGPQEALQVAGMVVSHVVRHRPGGDEDDVLVQFRSSGGTVPATASPWGDGLRVHFTKPGLGVAPGQVAVAYSGEDVLWSGIIDETWPATAEMP